MAGNENVTQVANLMLFQVSNLGYIYREDNMSMDTPSYIKIHRPSSIVHGLFPKEQPHDNPPFTKRRGRKRSAHLF
jgi:hypothetical protein